MGTTKLRTQLYRMEITKYFDEVKQNLFLDYEMVSGNNLRKNLITTLL